MDLHPLQIVLNKSLNGTYHIVRLRLSNKDQYVGADDREAEVEQDDRPLRANKSEEEKKNDQNNNRYQMI